MCYKIIEHLLMLHPLLVIILISHFAIILHKKLVSVLLYIMYSF